MCGTWAVVILAAEGADAAALGVLVGVAVLPYRRRPELAALAVAGLSLVSAAIGVPGDNAGTVAAGVTVTFALGRYADRRGLIALALLGIALLVPTEWVPIDLIFVAVVLGATWNCGRLVRRRSDEAARSAAVAAELAAVDPEELSARVIAEERSRLAGEALAVVRRAVAAMQAAAADAERDLDPRALSAVQAEGRTAVADLRRLLGLLRAEEAPALRPAPAESVPAKGRRLVTRADLGVTLALTALFLVEYALTRDGDARAWDIGLSLMLVAPLAVRRSHAALACVLAAVPWLLAVPLDIVPPIGLAALIALGLLAWSAAGEGRPRALVALAVLAVATTTVAGADDPSNLPALIALFVIPGGAGYLLGRRDREGNSAEAIAARLRSEQAATAERAAREERLRLARELHDVASHAVGVMVLQAGAALALRERDPAGAHAAVETLQRASVEAVSELDELFGALDAGAVGPPGLAAPAPEVALTPAIAAMVERVRVASLDVSVDVEQDVAPRGDVAAVVLRIVQEALTNTLRHAPGSQVAVSVTGTDGELVVDIRDDGPGTGQHEPGFGLVGLEERVRALGGEFAAAPGADGFVVRARIPLGAQGAAEVTA